MEFLQRRYVSMKITINVFIGLEFDVRRWILIESKRRHPDCGPDHSERMPYSFR